MHSYITIIDFRGQNLSENDIKDCVKQLHKLVSENENTRKLRTQDAYLLRFLHFCGFDVIAAYKMIKDTYDLIVHYPNWFAIDSPLDMKKQIEVRDKALLKRDRKGRPILVLKLGKMDIANSSPAEQSQILEMWLELVMDDPKTQASGMSIILDMNNYSWKILKWFTPSNVIIATKRMNLYPSKEMLLHIVNTSFLLNTSIKIIWPFFNEKIKNMFKFHFNNWSSLHEYISPDALPTEYGGTGPDIDFERSMQDLFEHNATIASKIKYHRISNV